jgi:hypothetical protein
MNLVGADKAKQEFEELLAAAWAEQFARLRTPPDSGDSVARGGDSVIRHEARSVAGENSRD